MKVLITGVSGQLGYDAAKLLQKQKIDFLGVSSKELDITDRDAVLRVFDTYHPDAVLHCAAWTKVDLAEDEPERCMRVNADGTRNVAEACRKIDAKLLYVSTDYVFPGTGEKPWETDDPTGPLNVYGKSKLAGEAAVMELVEKHFIVRTSWVIGEHGSNFVKTMLRLAENHDSLRVVDDQIGSPTFTADLAPLLCGMIVTDKYGCYHVTNEGGYISWYDFACEIFRQAGMSTKVIPVTTAEYGLSKAVRPYNSRLDKSKLSENGFERLPDWKDTLEQYLMYYEKDNLSK
jgi:dTDP-4-dehydrorhamnose reductase